MHMTPTWTKRAVATGCMLWLGCSNEHTSQPTCNNSSSDRKALPAACSLSFVVACSSNDSQNASGGDCPWQPSSKFSCSRPFPQLCFGVSEGSLLPPFSHHTTAQEAGTQPAQAHRCVDGSPGRAAARARQLTRTVDPAAQGLFKYHQYQVVGRHLPTDADPSPTLYRMKVWAKDAVRAKSKFW